MRKTILSALALAVASHGLMAQQPQMDASVFLQTDKVESQDREGYGNVAVKVTAKEMAAEPITDYLCGALFEMGYGDMEGPMWAEMLFNRKFEKFPPYMVNRNWWYMIENHGKNDLKTDWTGFDWYHSAYEHNLWYAAPGDEGPFHIDTLSTLFKETTPLSAVRLEFGQFAPDNRYVRVVNNDSKQAGIAQEGKWLRKGVAYTFTGKIRSVKGSGKARLLLFPEKSWDKPIASAEISLDGDFKNYTAKFDAGKFEGRATFALFIEGGDAVEIDDFSLMPDDNVRGWRRDVIEIISDMKPGALRWPGGCFASFYNWKDGIGDRDARVPIRSVMWGGWVYHDVGTKEYLDLCEMTGSTPFISVNMFHPAKIWYEYYDPVEGIYAKTTEYHPEFTDLEVGARLAADWVAYCNAPASHPMGALRARDGHPEPYNVKLWELDNELFRWFQTPEEHARAAKAYAVAMKEVDPTIQIGMCTYGGRLGQADNVMKMLDIAGEHIDFLANRAPSARGVQHKVDVTAAYREKTGRHIRYADTEFFLNGDSYTSPLIEKFKKERNERCLEHVTWAYAMAAAKNLMMWQRFGGEVILTNTNSFVNDHQNNLFETPKEGAMYTYPGDIYRLFSHSPAKWPLKLDGYEPDERKPVQVQAAWDINRERLVLYVYNSLPETRKAEFDLSALGKTFSAGAAETLSSPHIMDYSTVKEPREISRERKKLKIKGNSLKWEAAPHSFTEIVVQ